MEHLLRHLSSPGPADKISIRDGFSRLTLEELENRSLQVADFLHDQGINTLALLADNSIDWLVIDVACQLAGVCLLPLPTYFTNQQLKHAITSTEADAVLSDSPGKVAELFQGEACDQLEVPTTKLTCLAVVQTFKTVVLPPSTGKVTFTSGSTGNPKGVCLSNRQLICQARSIAEQVGLGKPRHLCLLPLSTLLENVAGVYTPLLSGGEVMVPSLTEIGYQASGVDYLKLADTITRYQPDTLIFTPELLKLVLRACDKGWNPPASLKFVAVGGARVSEGLLVAARQYGLPVYEGYGLSECASVVSLNTPHANRPGSAGRPLGSVQLSLGPEGEILVAGNVMLGYLGDQHSRHSPRFATGDIGYLDADGYLHISGRKKNLLISSFGRNINPEWPEAELLSHPAIRQCVVFGDSQPFCVGLIQPVSEDIDDIAIQQAVNEANARLPDYARVKHWLRLSIAEAGLFTPNGRPRRGVIQQRFSGWLEKIYQEQELHEFL